MLIWGEGRSDEEVDDPLIDEGMDEPEQEIEDGDYVISDGRGTEYHVAQYGRHLGTFNDRDAAMHEVYKRMSAERFWPNVWHVNDHGNVMMLDYEPELDPGKHKEGPAIACEACTAMLENALDASEERRAACRAGEPGREEHDGRGE